MEPHRANIQGSCAASSYTLCANQIPIDRERREMVEGAREREREGRVRWQDLCEVFSAWKKEGWPRRGPDKAKTRSRRGLPQRGPDEVGPDEVGPDEAPTGSDEVGPAEAPTSTLGLHVARIDVQFTPPSTSCRKSRLCRPLIADASPAVAAGSANVHGAPSCGDDPQCGAPEVPFSMACQSL